MQAENEELPVEPGGLVDDLNVDKLAELLTLAKDKGIELLPQLIAAAGILFVGWIIARIATRVLRKVLERAKVDATLREFMASLFYAALMVFVFIAGIQKLGVPTASFVAILGAAGFAIGFALQGSLSNLAAGMLLMFFRPIRVGDLVEVAGVEGVVSEIGVFATILNTLDNKRVTVANAKVTDENIVNYTINGKLRVDMTFGIGYGDDIDRAMAILERCLAEEALVLKDPKPMVAVSAHGDSAVEIVCRPWCDPADYWDLWFAMHRAVKKAFDAEGIEIPFPQRDVHLHSPAGSPVGAP